MSFTIGLGGHLRDSNLEAEKVRELAEAIHAKAAELGVPCSSLHVSANMLQLHLSADGQSLEPVFNQQAPPSIVETA